VAGKTQPILSTAHELLGGLNWAANLAWCILAATRHNSTRQGRAAQIVRVSHGKYLYCSGLRVI